MTEAWLKIGEIAALLGVSTKTLRHYQKLGLIEEPERTEGQYRLYAPHHLEKLRQIRDLQNLGLKLQEIRFVLDSANPETMLKQVLGLRLQVLEQEMEVLERQKDRATTLLQQEHPLQHLLEEKIPDFWKAHLDTLGDRLPRAALEREKQLMGKMLSFPVMQDETKLREELQMLESRPDLQNLLLDWTTRVDQTEDQAALDLLAREMADSEWLQGLLAHPEHLDSRQGDHLTQALLPLDTKEGWVLARIKHHLKGKSHEHPTTGPETV